MKGLFLKALCLLTVIVLAIGILPACKKDEFDDSDATKISFKSASTYETLKALDGQKVSINGYMATSSPVDGSFMFLMNMPYQSCPFCVPNTSQLSNTIEVYPKKNDSFGYTNQAIKVVGTLRVAPSEDEYFTDSYGYQFNFKIVDATYTILSSDEISADLSLWQELASTDIVTEIYAMYDYVNFLCAWNTYYVNTYTSASGELVPGYYLYPSDAYYLITTSKAQWNYGYVPGYFEGIINELKKIDESAFDDLIENINSAKALADTAFLELKAAYNGVILNSDADPDNDVTPNYTCEYKYLDKFGRYDYVYTLNSGDALTSELDKLYTEFSNWLSNWEL